MKCEWCNGSGVNPAKYGPVYCPDCDGRGQVIEKSYCLICRREMPSESGQVCHECNERERP